MLVNPSDIVARAKATITECSVRDAHECIDSDTLIIDIREQAEYHRGHIPSAVHLSRGLLEFHIHKVVEELGYKNVKSIDGGIVAWAQAQLPIVIPDQGLETCHTAGT